MLKMTKKLCKLQLLKRCEFYEKVTFLFKNSGFYHFKSTQENTENENSWRFSGVKSLQKKREKTENHSFFKSL